MCRYLFLWTADGGGTINHLGEVLKQYGIVRFQEEEITPRLSKIISDYGIFALKLSTLSAYTVNNWYRIYTVKEQERLDFIIPVYRNLKGDIVARYQHAIFYLMPWIENIRDAQSEPSYQILFRTLGSLHAITKQKSSLDTTMLEESVNQHKKLTEQKFMFLIESIEQIEKSRYISPFGLEVCTQFHQIEFVFNRLFQCYDNYLTDIQTEEIAFQAVCHGNLTSTHLMSTVNHDYLINWEYTRIHDPMLEVATIIKNHTATHDTPISQIIEALSYYEKNNPITNSQRSLLSIYLLQPDSYLSVIQEYFTNRKNHQLALIPNLLQAFRRLTNGLIVEEQLNQMRAELLKQDEVFDD